MLICLGIFALALSCGVAKSGQARAILWQDGSRKEVQEAAEIAAISLRLLNSAQDVSLLIAAPGLVDAIKDEDTSLEVILPEAAEVELISGYRGGISRMLIPLSGEYCPADSFSILMFYGTSGGYITPPVLNHGSAGELGKIKQLLEL